jgi:hypothetical protein
MLALGVQEAAKAVKEMDNHKLDKMHVLRCYRVDDLDRLRNVPDEYVQPEKAVFDEGVRAYTLPACLLECYRSITLHRDVRPHFWTVRGFFQTFCMRYVRSSCLWYNAPFPPSFSIGSENSIHFRLNSSFQATVFVLQFGKHMIAEVAMQSLRLQEQIIPTLTLFVVVVSFQ